METTSFLNKCKGISLVVGSVALLFFGAAALIFSTTPAQADAPQMGNGAGKYQMSLSSLVSSKGTTYWYVLVWDTETGRSRMYYGNQNAGMKAAGGQFNLPSSPL
jgi:hypothetical protein